MATRHLLALGLAALLSVGASSAMAGSFGLVPQGNTNLAIGESLTIDVIYFGAPGDPDVFGINLRVFFSDQTQLSSGLATGLPEQQWSIIGT